MTITATLAWRPDLTLGGTTFDPDEVRCNPSPMALRTASVTCRWRERVRAQRDPTASAGAGRTSPCVSRVLLISDLTREEMRERATCSGCQAGGTGAWSSSRSM